MKSATVVVVQLRPKDLTWRCASLPHAGDAFAGGFTAGLVNFDSNQLAAARFANAVATLSVLKFGTAPSMLTTTAIARFPKSSRRA